MSPPHLIEWVRKPQRIDRKERPAIRSSSIHSKFQDQFHSLIFQSMYQSSGLSIRTPGLRKRDQGRRGPLLD